MGLSASDCTDKLLDDLMHLGDEPADQVARSYLDEVDGGPGALVAKVARYHHLPHEQRDPKVREFIHAPGPLPSWADPDRLANGARFFDDWGVELGLGLLCFSLPAGYAAARYAQVLHLTARLESDCQRRVYESAQMVLDVTTPGGMLEGGVGHKTARRVRLMHAAVRQLILADDRVAPTCIPRHDANQWCDCWGVPISQEQLLGATLDFGWAMLGVLDTLKIPYDQTGADDYLHLWSTVAHFMGVRPDLLPIEREAASKLDPMLRRRNFSASPAGHRMTAALVDVLNRAGPARILRGSPVAMMRLLLGEEIADTAGVPDANWTRYLVRASVPFMRRTSLGELHSRVVQEAGRSMTRAALEAFVHEELHGRRPRFQMPTRLGRRLRVRHRRVIDLTDSATASDRQPTPTGRRSRAGADTRHRGS